MLSPLLRDSGDRLEPERPSRYEPGGRALFTRAVQLALHGPVPSCSDPRRRRRKNRGVNPTSSGPHFSRARDLTRTCPYTANRSRSRSVDLSISSPEATHPSRPEQTTSERGYPYSNQTGHFSFDRTECRSRDLPDPSRTSMLSLQDLRSDRTTRPSPGPARVLGMLSTLR